MIKPAPINYDQIDENYNNKRTAIYKARSRSTARGKIQQMIKQNQSNNSTAVSNSKLLKFSQININSISSAQRSKLNNT